jgi:hypothetical protein
VRKNGKCGSCSCARIIVERPDVVLLDEKADGRQTVSGAIAGMSEMTLTESGSGSGGGRVGRAERHFVCSV